MWQQIAVGSNSIHTVAPIQLLACDTFKELLWVGSSDGHLSCCYSPELEQRVRVQAHSKGQRLLQLTPFQSGVLSTAGTGVRFHNRGGVLQTEYETRSFVHEITAATVFGDNYASTELILGGLQDEPQIVMDHESPPNDRPTLAMIDVLTNQLLMQVPTSFVPTTLASGRVLACGTSSSSIFLHDPRTFESIRTLPGHQGGSRKVIIKGDRLLSLGYSVSPETDAHGYGRVDNVVKVYDLRTYRPLPPLIFTLGGGPADACFLPNFSSTIVVVGLTGTWQTLDCEAGIPSPDAFQIELNDQASISAISMSTTGDLMFFGDTLGGLHTWSDKAATVNQSLSEIRMNPFSTPVQYVTPDIEPPPVAMDEFTPLVAIEPIPVHDSTPLLSDLTSLPQPTNFIPPSIPPIDDKLLHLNYTIKFHEFIGYINYSSQYRTSSINRGSGPSSSSSSSLITINEHPNEYEPNKSNFSGSSSTHGTNSNGFIPNHLPTLVKFVGKGRSIDRLHKKKSLPRFGDSTFSYQARDALLISKEYARVTIKIPRFGLYAFDFSSYNKTHYTGLDNLLPNSYCNPIIQLLYFIAPIRSSMRAHLCDRENCLTCELGFLFHMLDHGRGQTAEPRNFLRALRQLPEAGGLGLLDMHENNSTIQSPIHASSQAGSSLGGGGGLKNRLGDGDGEELFLASKIQDFLRFLLEQLHKEERESPAYNQLVQEKQHQLHELEYVSNMNHQRRQRNFNLSLQQLQQNLVGLQQSMQQQGQQGNIDSLRAQLQHFIAQQTAAYEEYEKIESELFQAQLAQLERELTQVQQTTIERVFGAQVEQRISCQGSQNTAAHESIQSKTTLYFKLSAYPSHETTDLSFDHLLADSLDDSDSGTQRLFCNTCSSFTIQSHAKSVQTARAHTHAPPDSSFPQVLNVMANVTTDLQWDWWKQRDERFGHHTYTKRTKPTNLYERFMAAGPSDNATKDETGYQFKSGVVNAPSTAPSSSSSQLTNEQLEGLDVNFLPHYLLVFISRHANSSASGATTPSSNTQSTRIFRIQHTVAHRLQATLATLKSFEQAHYDEIQQYTHRLLTTELELSAMQQQYIFLTQQSFVVQSKLSLVIGQQQSILTTLHTLTQQVSHTTGPTANMLSHQIQTLQTSLRALGQQSTTLQTQKLQLSQKLSAIQTPTQTQPTMGSNQPITIMMGALPNLQSKVQLLQAQIDQLQQTFDERMNSGEAELRHIITDHLSHARGSGFEPSLLASASLSDFAVYELATVIAHIADPPEKDSPLHTINGEHLVAHIKVERDIYDQIETGANRSTQLVKQLTPTAASSPHQQDRHYSSNRLSTAASPHSPTTNSLAVPVSEHDGAWFVFNDFVIRPSNGYEATRFSYEWKQPCAVVYKLMNPHHINKPHINRSVTTTTGSTTNPRSPTSPTSPSSSSTAVVTSGSTTVVSPNPFMHESTLYSYSPSLAARYHDSMRSFQPLSPMEYMDSSTLVAIDCEFVSVQSDLLETDAITGESVVVRPARLTLARVSVVRGIGPMTGVPFIDDYIATSEPVVDYLTKFSGIVPGDLDRSVSSHHLTTLKHAYVRLRAMIERGVKFIGHGLKKDLQMLNLIIPSEQVFDTVELFSLPNQRKLGLRFLALHVLHVNIQQDTHDSIEDARTALHLYHKYRELQQKGQLQQCIQQLYDIGHRSGFKVE